MITETIINNILVFSQLLGAIGFFIFLVLKIKNHLPKDVRSNEKFKVSKEKKREDINRIFLNKVNTDEDIKDRISIVDINLINSSNNTNAVLFFIPFLYGLLSPYLNNLPNALNEITAIVILLIAFFLYPYLGFKSDKTYDLKVELRVLEDMLEEVNNT